MESRLLRYYDAGFGVWATAEPRLFIGALRISANNTGFTWKL